MKKIILPPSKVYQGSSCCSIIINKMTRLYLTGSNKRKPNQPTNADRAKNRMKQDYLFMRTIKNMDNNILY
jgi:hypothetical protein